MESYQYLQQAGTKTYKNTILRIEMFPFTIIFLLLKSQNDQREKTALQHLSISIVEFLRTNFNS